MVIDTPEKLRFLLILLVSDLPSRQMDDNDRRLLRELNSYATHF